MNRLTRISATVASSACLVAGFAGIAGASPASITNTGNNSSTDITQTNRTRTRVETNARVRATNNNPQVSETGAVTSTGNRDAGDVSSGAASTTSDTLATVNVDTSSGTAAALAAAEAAVAANGSGDASIEDTGNSSAATITQRNNVRTRVLTNADIEVVNNNAQTSRSGAVTSTDNRDTGSATSGNASSDSLTTFEVNVTQ